MQNRDRVALHIPNHRISTRENSRTTLDEAARTTDREVRVRAMVLCQAKTALRSDESPDPTPGVGQVLTRGALDHAGAVDSKRRVFQVVLVRWSFPTYIPVRAFRASRTLLSPTSLSHMRLSLRAPIASWRSLARSFS